MQAHICTKLGSGQCWGLRIRREVIGTGTKTKTHTYQPVLGTSGINRVVGAGVCAGQPMGQTDGQMD